MCSEPYEVWFSVFTVIEGTVCIVGPFLNGIVCFTFYKNPQMLTSQNMFIFSLTFSDFLMSQIAVPMAWAANFMRQWPFGTVGCQIHAFLIFQFGLVSITHLTAATVEKYLTVAKSMIDSSYLTKAQTMYVIAGLWLYTLTFSLSPLFGMSHFGLEGLNASCSILWDTDNTTEHVYFSFVFIGCFIFPVCLIFVCNFRLLQTMKGIRVGMFNIAGRNSEVVRRFYRQEKRAMIRFAIMVLAFLVAYAPYAVVSVVVITRGSSAVHPVVLSITAVFAKTSCLYNSIVNVFSYKRFRKMVLKEIPFCKNTNTVVPIDQ